MVWNTRCRVRRWRKRRVLGRSRFRVGAQSSCLRVAYLIKSWGCSFAGVPVQDDKFTTGITAETSRTWDSFERIWGPPFPQSAVRVLLRFVSADTAIGLRDYAGVYFALFSVCAVVIPLSEVLYRSTFDFLNHPRTKLIKHAHLERIDVISCATLFAAVKSSAVFTVVDRKSRTVWYITAVLHSS